MAEAVVNVVVEQLISATAEWLKDETSLIKGVKEEVENMSLKMQTIQKVLDDAENKSMKEPTIKLWLEKLQDISYDMEDVFDEWNTRVLMQNDRQAENYPSNEISSSSSSSNKFTCSSLKQFNCFTTVKQLGWRRDIALRIKDINERMNLIFSEMDRLSLISKLVVNDVQTETMNNIHTDRMTTSHVVTSEVYGRDDAKNILLLKVLTEGSEELMNSSKGLKLISIVGAGGLGKTTLAQLVYNDETVRAKFNPRIWVCVSDSSDEAKVARAILEGMGIDHSKMDQLQNLYESIKESVAKQRFLLVLDDVWDDKFEKWNKLRARLLNGGNGSIVLVTTRSERVAEMMGTAVTNMIKPNLITDSDCWSIMCQIAFNGKTMDNSKKLERIGQEIAIKCKGLPLAARTLGGLLLSKSTEEEWTRVLKSEIWELENVELELFPHLFLSYRELPPTLKRCFSYFAIFPKDYFVRDDELISLWMAHGYLKPRRSKEEMMQVGKEYFKCLVSRALFEQKTAVACVASMHDIMHDFALHLVNHEFLSVVHGNDNSTTSDFTRTKLLYPESKKARHLYVRGSINPMAICNARKLRSCIVTGLPQIIIVDLVKHLKVVRALYLKSCNMEQVPQEIGKLIHLRTLDLSDNPFSELPTTIGDLYNLQCLWLEKLRKLSSFPQPIGRLINLHELRGLHFGTGSRNLGLLKNLNQLRGVLEIHFTNDYTDELDAREAKLEQKLCITELAFRFNKHVIKAHVFESLQAPPNLQCLEMSDFCCGILPSWIISLQHLSKLVVTNGFEVFCLPALGKLRCLKELELDGLLGLKCISREFLGIDDNTSKKLCAFPELVELKVSYCPNLKEWEDIKPEDDNAIVMPKLEFLEFVWCPKLDKLPLLLLSKASPLKGLMVSQGKLLESSTFITSLKYITNLHLGNMNANSLPPFGKLIFLETLYIRDLAGLKCISSEFLGIGDDHNKKITVFPNLTELLINDCNELERWEDLKLEDDSRVTVMPKLQILLITRCPKFEVLPCRLLRKLSSLKRLVIPCCKPTFTLTIKDEEMVDGVNGSQQKQPELECFRISKCKGSKLPNSILSLKNLVRLTIHDAQKVLSLPALGTLPFLEELYIQKFQAVTSVGKEFLGIDNTNNNNSFVAFPKLVKLDLECLEQLKEWEDIKPEDNCTSVMPELRVLEIRYCSNLEKLPRRILLGAPSLKTLNFHNNSDSLTKGLKDDRELVLHIKEVYVDKLRLLSGEV